MAHNTTPKFHNDQGLAKIRIGSKEFQCIGAQPPYDHPHIFLDMGDDNEIVCPYCSTLFCHDEKLAHDEADPAHAAYHGSPEAA